MAGNLAEIERRDGIESHCDGEQRRRQPAHPDGERICPNPQQKSEQSLRVDPALSTAASDLQPQGSKPIDDRTDAAIEISLGELAVKDAPTAIEVNENVGPVTHYAETDVGANEAAGRNRQQNHGASQEGRAGR